MPVGLIFALHGFLGKGSDWDQVKQNVKNFDWITPSLFSPEAETDFTFENVKNFNGKKIFVGYSLGGRIGLSILNSRPQLFDHYFFISVNPGFSETDKMAREQRVISDAGWAAKISLSNWKSFLNEWNTQPVFAGSAAEPVRSAEDFDLSRLQEYLKRWSLGLQPDYSNLVKENKSRITWIVGAEDSKFITIAEDLKFKRAIDSYVQIESGHRIPFNSPKKLSDIINSVAEKT